MTSDIIRAQFDRIATLQDAEAWDHSTHYHDHLLGHLPARLGEALEIGCGAGAFTRRLAERAERVLALDLSPEMIRIAQQRSPARGAIEYRVADVLATELPRERFDCVASIATLHHLPLDRVLATMARALAPGGTLLVLDLFRNEGIGDWTAAAIGWWISRVLRLGHGSGSSPELRRAWDEHWRQDRFSTLREVRAACTAVLPGAPVVTRHFLWRYSIVWRKDGG